MEGGGEDEPIIAQKSGAGRARALPASRMKIALCHNAPRAAACCLLINLFQSTAFRLEAAVSLIGELADLCSLE